MFLFRYSKLEFQQARSLWMAGMRHLGDVEATEADYETQFSVMVEQEVERRLFQVSLYYFFFRWIDRWSQLQQEFEQNSAHIVSRILVRKKQITTWVFQEWDQNSVENYDEHQVFHVHCVQKTADYRIHITKQLTSDDNNTDYICK